MLTFVYDICLHHFAPLNVDAARHSRIGDSAAPLVLHQAWTEKPGGNSGGIVPRQVIDFKKKTKYNPQIHQKQLV